MKVPVPVRPLYHSNWRLLCHQQQLEPHPLVFQRRSANWPWQSWYVNTGVNVDPLIVAAEKVEAWHYIGAAKVIKAWGFGYPGRFLWNAAL